jgi:hypothetical protein
MVLKVLILKSHGGSSITGRLKLPPPAVPNRRDLEGLQPTAGRKKKRKATPHLSCLSVTSQQTKISRRRNSSTSSSVLYIFEDDKISSIPRKYRLSPQSILRPLLFSFL